MYRVLDLFSGAGGFSYGLKLTKKIKIIAALDINEEALLTFKKNHPNTKTFQGDIKSEKIKKKIIDFCLKNKVNMIIGGPPCQGFSMKGKKLGLKDPRNYLFQEFFKIVKKISPKIFIMENVSSIISSSNGYFIKEIIKKFEKLSYITNYGILDSSNFGVPQIRKRAFIIGSIKTKINFPKKQTNKKITVYDAISDLSFLEFSDINFERDYIIKPKSNYQKIMRINSLKLFNHSPTKHTNETIYKLKLIPEKGNKFDLPIELRTNQKFKTTWSRLHWDKPSPTIDTRFDTPSNGQNTHPILNRAITQREAARIQSFPDDFIFYGKKTSICKQIGNAVPPLLAKEIGLSIIKQTEKNLKKKFTIWNDDSYKMFNDFPNESIDAIITDPPYNISKKNNFKTMKNKRKGIDFGAWDKKFDLTTWIEKYYPKIKKGGSIIIFCSYLYISHISDKLIEIGANVKDIIKWIKKNPMPRNIKRRYVSDTEFAIWAVKPNKKWIFNKIGASPYLRAEFKTPTVSGKERTKHPTQKSLKLMENIIKIHTNKGNIILDPFMGSGTTGVACLKNDRLFLGIEKEKEYFEISTKRLENIQSNKNIF